MIINRNKKFQISEGIINAYQYLHQKCVEDKPRLHEKIGSEIQFVKLSQKDDENDSEKKIKKTLQFISNK